MTGEWSQYYRRGSLHDLEVLHARFIEHRFARHSHDYYVIGFVEAGVQAYSYRGARHLTPAGQIFLVNPGEPHTGEAATHRGYVYRTVYRRVVLMQQVAAEVTIRNALPFFTGAVVRDESLRERLLRFHYAVAEGAPTLSVESTLIDAIAHLIRRQADDRRSRSRGLNERTAVRKAREYIEAHYDAEVSLWELATPVHLSPFYFARAFQKEVGLPPHAYLENVRVKCTIVTHLAPGALDPQRTRSPAHPTIANPNWITIETIPVISILIPCFRMRIIGLVTSPTVIPRASQDQVRADELDRRLSQPLRFSH